MKSQIRLEGCEMLVKFSDCTPAELDALVGRLVRVLGYLMGGALRPTTSTTSSTSSAGFQYIAESQAAQDGVGSDPVAPHGLRPSSVSAAAHRAALQGTKGTKRNPPRPAATPPERGHGATGKRSRRKVCVICGKEFTDKSPTNTRKVCGALCARKRDADRHPRKPAAPARAPDGNPADPLLTDSQRAELQKQRLAAIAAAAQKYKD